MADALLVEWMSLCAEDIEEEESAVGWVKGLGAEQIGADMTEAWAADVAGWPRSNGVVMIACPPIADGARLL